MFSFSACRERGNPHGQAKYKRLLFFYIFFEAVLKTTKTSRKKENVQ